MYTMYGMRNCKCDINILVQEKGILKFNVWKYSLYLYDQTRKAQYLGIDK